AVLDALPERPVADRLMRGIVRVGPDLLLKQVERETVIDALDRETLRLGDWLEHDIFLSTEFGVGSGVRLDVLLDELRHLSDGEGGESPVAVSQHGAPAIFVAFDGCDRLRGIALATRREWNRAHVPAHDQQGGLVDVNLAAERIGNLLPE